MNAPAPPSRRQECAIDSVAPGSVLADPVYDAHSTPLLPAGAALTEAHLQSLRRRGIASLVILVPLAADGEAAAAEGAEGARVEARIEYLFRHAGDNPALRDLRQRILDFRRRPK